MSTMKSVIAKFRKELRTTYQAQKNILDVTDKYLTQLEDASTGGGSEVSVTQIQTTGTKIATVTVDSVGTDIYAPKASVTQTVASGTEIAEVDGTKIYIPDAGSVSVTADGVKTWATLLATLFSLIDFSKVTSNTYGEIITSLGINRLNNHYQRTANDYIVFVDTELETNYVRVNQYKLASTGVYLANSSSTTVSDRSTQIPTNGTIIKIVY